MRALSGIAAEFVRAMIVSLDLIVAAVLTFAVTSPFVGFIGVAAFIGPGERYNYFPPGLFIFQMSYLLLFTLFIVFLARKLVSGFRVYRLLWLPWLVGLFVSNLTFLSGAIGAVAGGGIPAISYLDATFFIGLVAFPVTWFVLGNWLKISRTCPACGRSSPVLAVSCVCGFGYPADQQTAVRPRLMRGWLILLAIQVCIFPLLGGSILIRLALDFGPAWQKVTAPGIPFRLGALMLLLGELFVVVALFVWSLVLVYRFFTRKSSFPSTAITFLLNYIVIVLLTAYLPGALPVPLIREQGQTNYPIQYLLETVALLGNVASVATWIQYLRVSKRVHATFTA